MKLRRLAAVVVLGATVMLSASSAAANPISNAADDAARTATDAIGCTSNVPAIGSPGEGFLDAIDSGPQNAPTGDPFAERSDTSTYDAYGYAANTWPGYDTGCSANGFVNGAANGVWVTTNTLTALSVAATRLALNPATLAVMEPFQRIAASAIGGIFMPLFVVAACLTALYGLWFVRRTTTGETISNATRVLGFSAIGFVLLTFPVAIAPQVDKVVTGVPSVLNQQMSGVAGDETRPFVDTFAGNVNREVLYNVWCTGMIGRSDAALAAEYCPKLYAASSFTRAEVAQIKAGQADANELYQRDQDDYRELMTELRHDHKAAYAMAAGNKPFERLGYAFLALMGWLSTFGLLGVAVTYVLIALTVFRVQIAFAPIVLLMAQMPNRGELFSRLLSSIVTRLGLSMGLLGLSAIFVAAVGGILSPDSETPGWLALLCLMLLSTAAWIAFWRFSRDWRAAIKSARQRAEEFRKQRRARRRQSAEDGPRTIDDVFDGDTDAGRTTTAPAMQDRPTLTRSVVTGAAQGAAVTGIAGLATGGTLTVAGVLAGAAKGATVAGAAAAAERATKSAAVGAAIGNATAAKFDQTRPRMEQVPTVSHGQEPIELGPVQVVPAKVVAVEIAPAEVVPAAIASAPASTEAPAESSTHTTEPLALPASEPTAKEPVRSRRRHSGTNLPVYRPEPIDADEHDASKVVVDATGSEQ